MVAGVDDDGSFIDELNQYIGASGGNISGVAGDAVGSVVVTVFGWIFLCKGENDLPTKTSSNAGSSYSAPSPDDDDDDDYFEDDDNFGGRKRIGKQNGHAPRSNQSQNSQFRNATRNLSKDKQQQVHREISHQGYGHKEIKEIASDFFVFILGLFWEEE